MFWGFYSLVLMFSIFYLMIDYSIYGDFSISKRLPEKLDPFELKKLVDQKEVIGWITVAVALVMLFLIGIVLGYENNKPKNPYLGGVSVTACIFTYMNYTYFIVEQSLYVQRNYNWFNK